jgi:hypothetical protein
LLIVVAVILVIVAINKPVAIKSPLIYGEHPERTTPRKQAQAVQRQRMSEGTLAREMHHSELHRNVKRSAEMTGPARKSE